MVRGAILQRQATTTINYDNDHCAGLLKAEWSNASIIDNGNRLNN